MSVVHLVNDSFTQHHFIDILFADDSELILNDGFVIFHFRDNILSGDLILLVRVLYVVVLLSTLKVFRQNL